MYSIKHKLAAWHGFLDEISDAGAGGSGGGEGDLNVDIGKASDSIGADLGLGGDDNKGALDDLDPGSATPPEKKEAGAPAESEADKAAREARERAVNALAKPDAAKVAAAKAALTAKKVDFAGKTDAEILKLAEPQGKALPKAWKKEMDKLWAGLPPEAQAYIEQREIQTEEGFKAQSETANYGKQLREVMQPYEALLTAQGVKDHGHAVKAVMNAHYVLSTAEPEKKARFMADLAKNYGVDLQAALNFFSTAAAGGGGATETAAEKANRERIERLENERAQERRAAFESVKAQSAAEVEAFASDPAHPYFNEVGKEVALLLRDPQMTLAQAYESAVWANPVTREKEKTRLREESEATARKEAEEKAKLAEKARGTKVRGKEEHRASPDLMGTMEDTMRETMTTIKNRT